MSNATPLSYQEPCDARVWGCHTQAMTRWRRADPVGIAGWITSIFLVIGAAFVVFATVGFVRGGTWLVNPVLGMLGFYGFMVLWLGFAWRLNRTGIYISDQALRITHPWRTRILPWTEVAKIHSQPAMLAGWATARHAIWIRLRDGSQIETPIQCRPTASFGSGPLKNIGPVLSRTNYDASLQALREAQKRATGRSGSAGAHWRPGVRRQGSDGDPSV